MPEYKRYRRTQIAEMADWEPGFDMTNVSISQPDRDAGSPKAGDKIARNPANHADRWLVAANYFAANFEKVEGGNSSLDNFPLATLIVILICAAGVLEIARRTFS